MDQCTPIHDNSDLPAADSGASNLGPIIVFGCANVIELLTPIAGFRIEM